MNRIHIIGRKNSGKTTLVVDLVRHFCSLGYRVGTIKHTHHHHELDTPGKDSFRHRQAGAMAVGIVAPTMNAVFWPAPNHECGEGQNHKIVARTLPGEVSAVALDPTRPYAQLDALMAGYDLVLVEGDQQAQAIKIEVWHQGLEEPPLVDSNRSIALVVTNDPVHAPVTHRRDDVPTLGSRILKLAGVGLVHELGAANQTIKEKSIMKEKRELEHLVAKIASPDSPVGMDAVYVHALILDKLQQLDERLERLEQVAETKRAGST